MMASPEKFVKPADLFKMRRSSKCKQELTTQSPMKCLNNFADPSPTKNLPVLLKNPFKNQPVKRRLNLGSASNSPVKRSNVNNNNNNNSNQSSPSKRSPTKRNPKLEMDEDANMEAPPRFSLHESVGILTPRKRAFNQAHGKGPCYQNDWTLRTKVRVNFATSCKNWSHDKATTHKRHSGSAHDEDTPSKVNDKTISLEAIKNAATVYQHPYLSWLPLFPRCDKKAPTATSVSHRDSGAGILSLTKHSEASKMMHLDWCESLNDLLSLVTEGKCPFFYLCADNYSILFRYSSDHDIQAHISPMSNGMRSALLKEGVQINCDEDNDTENSQSGFEDEMSEILGDIDDDEDDDASQFLESLNIPISQQDFPTLYGKSNNKTPNDNNPDSNSQSNKSASQRQLATIQGRENIKKLERFLKTNRLYTISKVGDFACIPPTLLAPREFRLCTPRYPDVVIAKHHLSGSVGGNSNGKQQLTPNQLDTDNNSKAPRDDAIDTDPAKSNNSTSTQPPSHIPLGLKHVELRGIVLPNLFRKLHKLLTVSDNADHTCSSIQLDSSVPFKTIHFSASC